MYSKKNLITVDILNILSDCQEHKIKEIADRIEVCEKTVRRHIQALSYCCLIHTYHGGINKGGVKLLKYSIYQRKTLSPYQLEILKVALNFVLEHNLYDKQDLMILFEFFGIDNEEYKK